MALINHHSVRFFILIISLIALLISSCEKNDDKDLSEDYYDKAIITANKRFGFYYEGKAFNYLDSTYRHAKELTVNERFKFYGFYCGYYYQAVKDYSKAMAYADSMVWIIEESNNESKMVKQHAQAYYSKGDVYFAAGNYEDAYKYYFKTKVIAKELDQCTLSEYSYRLGMVLYKQKRFRSAADNFKITFAQANNCKPVFPVFWRQQEVLNNIALSYTKANMPDSALVYYTKALKFIDLNEHKYKVNANTYRVARGVVYGNMGDIYMQKGNLDTAEELFKKSIINNSAPLTDLADGQLTRIKLARLYKQQNRRDAFRQTLNSVKGGMDSVYNADVKMNWYGLMSDYYRSLNEPRQALEHLLTYNLLKDSIQKSNEGLIGGDVNAQLLGLEKEYEIDILRKNSQLQQMYLVVAVIFTLMILVIVFLVFKNGQRSKRSLIELWELNDQINQQKKTLEKTLDSLEQSSKEKDRILHTVAHDLRNPIGGIAALSGLMLDNGENTSEQEEVFSLIRNTSKDTLILINELLEAAHGNLLELTNKQWVDVNSLLSNNADLLQFKAQEKNQRILTELPDEEQQIFVNREKMSRVISNLISNAIKFSPEQTDILIRACNSKGKLIISVSDQGIGIPDELKEKIFDMFTTAKRPGTSGEKPFGLGLNISYEIVRAHKGRLWFENNPGAGVTFYIELPTGNQQPQYSGNTEH
ncbi:MAG TPA: ATP-binding protein [Daejeonella sp.]|uniref:tetratricopeptide repeat-containing sensor histidine kinase n=1 Tax=Daejeonella sp. TaxID=2805397 RepID=UPI002ED90D2C